MKRTPLWIFVAAVGVQLAALGLCAWVMEHWPLRAEPKRKPEPEPAAAPEAAAPAPAAEESPPAPASEEPAPAPAPEEPAPAASPEPSAVTAPVEPAVAESPVVPDDPSRLTAAEVALIRQLLREPSPSAEPTGAPQPPALPEPAAPVEPAAPRPEDVPATPEATAVPPEPAATPPYPGSGRATVRAIDPPPRPVLGVPPHGVEPPLPAVPRYITEPADAATQVVTGTIGDRSVTFGFYPDGNIRFVDVDGGRYTGKAESARARMHEVDGDRAFTVQIGVDAAGRLQATFSGGLHRAATFPLEPLVGWSAA